MEQTSKISRARLVVVTTMELQDLLLKLKGIDCLCERGLLNNPIKKCVQTKRQSWFLVRNTIITCVGLYIAIAGFNQNILSTRNTYTNRDAAIAVQHSFLRKADQEYLNHRRHKEECEIYLARSSLPDVNGFGVYTTSAYSAGSNILSSFDGPTVPIVDYEFYRHNREDAQEDLAQWRKVFENYWWVRDTPDQMVYEGQQIYNDQRQLGSLPNHNCILGSIAFTNSDRVYDDALLDPSSPGLGAISYYNGVIPQVTRDVPGGSELFLDYGFCNREQWQDNYPEWAESIPMKDDYSKAVLITFSLWDSLDSKGLLISNSDTASSEQANQFIANFKNNTKTSSVIRNLIPGTIEQLQRIMMNVDRENEQSNDTMEKLLATTTGSTTRTPDWVRTNGVCLENLVPGKTKTPHAGRGAIAQFALKKGDIVVPVPSLQITNKDVLKMSSDHSDLETRDRTQLLLNYCLGHHESSLLLCPQTNVILVNHCSASNPENCGSGPNAKLQWSSGWDDVSSQWLQLTIEEVAERSHPGISMEVVALRDIQPGEEVFIDYGDNWDAAWKAHVASWKPPQRAPGSITSVSQANANLKETLRRVAVHNTRLDYDFPDVFTGCVYLISESDEDEKWKKPVDWEGLDDADILEKYGEDAARFSGIDPGMQNDGLHWPCSIIREEKLGQTYTVRLWYMDMHPPQPWLDNGLPRLLTNFPRENIQFFHKNYHSDQHLEGAFRHHIGIPDDIMPSHWKNRG